MNKIIIIGICLVFTACGSSSNDFDATGVFETTDVLVSAQGNGEIFAFNIVEGMELKAGEMVGYIDTTQLHLNKLQLIASKSSIESRKQNVQEQIASLEEQLRTAKKDLKRFKNLVKKNVVNQKQLDDVQSQVAFLNKQIAAQKSNLENNNTSIQDQGNALKIQIAQVEDQLKKCKISSPISGIVLDKYAEAGELTAIGKPLFKVSNINQMYLRAYITSDQIQTIKLGQNVWIYADFGNKHRQEYQGTISWISNIAEFTPKTIQTKNERANTVYAIKIIFQNDGIAKRGMYGEVKFKKK